MSNSIRLRAFAKINLGLQVRPRRPDGFHELFTVYQTIGLHDRLTISLRKGRGEIQVECDHPAIPGGPNNLVYKACDLWRRTRKFRNGFAVRLEKNIPVGSGLGGGSSDAAATLLGLERLTGNRLNPSSLLSVASHLGSDVPLFLWGGRVLGCGRGEEVYPLWDLPRRPCLVVFPTFSMPTAEAYRELDRHAGSQLTKGSKHSKLMEFGAWPHFSLKEWGPAENDFEKVVFARWPELARLKAQLIQAGAESTSLTGSGSAVFALFDSAPKLVRALKVVPAAWQVFKTRTLPRDEYKRLMF